MDYRYIEELALKSKADDMKSKEKLIEEFKPLIMKISQRTFIYGYTSYDIENECYSILSSCLDSYKSENHRFVAFATISLKNNINYILRKSIKHKSSEGKEALILDDALDMLMTGSQDIEVNPVNSYINSFEKPFFIPTLAVSIAFFSTPFSIPFFQLQDHIMF
ncbi:MAG: hypothetical protein ACI32Y_09525 [Clostridium sp.]